MRFLTLVYEKDREKEYLNSSKVALQVADNVLQWNLAQGLLENLGAEAWELVNSVPMGSWPKANRQILFPTEQRRYQGVRLQNIGFWNLPLLKPVSRFFSYVRLLGQKHPHSDKVLLYGLYLPQLLALRWVKKRHPLDVCVIIDDLPAQFGIVTGNRLKVFLKTWLGKRVLALLNDPKTVDRFVLLSEHMTDALELQGRPYCVVEGVANPVALEEAAPQDKKIIFYAGTLNKQFGILTLLEAFRQIESEEYALWICGDGDARGQVEAAAEKDSRIRYYGFVGKGEADRLRNMATVLVNPRSNEGAYTRYSFPSKTIEYLLAEKPVVMYRLDGIPADYDPWLYYIPENTPESMAKLLQQVCESDPETRRAHAQQARQWVISHKNPTAQTKKILDLFDK